jgi:Tol biopolymer transport system component
MEQPPPSVVQLTPERTAGTASFSPDGTQVVYDSAGDIWLRIVGRAESRRLTGDPAPESSPAWSPDGTTVAFLRSPGAVFDFFAGQAIHLVSPLGGPARKLSDFPAGYQLSWSPDGRWLAAAKARTGSDPPGGIHLISVATGEVRTVTSPEPPVYHVNPAFSPDGRALAFASCDHPGFSPCAVHILSLGSDLEPQGAPRQLTPRQFWNWGIAWAREGRSIVYSAGGGLFNLWQVSVDGGSAPERVELAGYAVFPSTTRRGDRLAFAQRRYSPDLYRLDREGSSTPLVESMARDMHPDCSPDGRRIAFGSDRSGGTEIWLAEADGSNPMRLTHGPGAYQGSPRWSPDGRWIAFDSWSEEGGADVWTIGADGSGLHQITRDPGDDYRPTWSRDGRSLYFTSNRTGREEIWRTAAAGGSEEQLTHEGGGLAIESADGATLFYRRSDGGLVARPTEGGKERTIATCVDDAGYAVAPLGVFYTECTGQALRFWEAVAGRDREVAALEGKAETGLAVFPDGATLIFGRNKDENSLMMIDNFR